MLEEIDRALRHAKDRARHRDDLNRRHSEVSTRLDATRAQIGELERRLAPVDPDPREVQVDTDTVLGMVQSLRARATELAGHVQALEGQLAEFEDAPQQLADALDRKEELLRRARDPRAAELAELAERLATLDGLTRAHEAAYESGIEARRWVNAMRGDLDVARRYSDWDVGGRGMDGILTNVAKQRRMREADEAAEEAKKELTTFARRLADIGVTANPQLVGIANSWVGDVVFDNFLTDAVKHKQIVMTGAQADDMARWLTQMANWLRERILGFDRERAELVSRREGLLLGESTGRSAASVPDEIDHGVRAARERVRRHEQLTRSHAGLSPRLESIVTRLQELKGRLAELERRLGRPDTVSFTSLLASLSAADVGTARPRMEAEALRLVTSAQRDRKQQLFGDLRVLQRDLGELTGAQEEYAAAVGRRDAALRGHPRGGELAEIIESLGDADAESRGYEQAVEAGTEAAEALAAVRRDLGQGGPAGPGGPGHGGGPAELAGQGGLHQADRTAWRAQRALDVLAGRLAGLGVGTDPHDPLPETCWFADTLLDTIISDLAEHRQIGAAATQVDEMERWAVQTTEWLRARHAEVEEHRSALGERCARLLR